MQAAKRHQVVVGRDGTQVLAAELQAFEKLREELERRYFGKFVIFHDGKFFEAFDNFDLAARKAIAVFGKGPYLIREVGKNGLGAGTAIHLR